MRIVGLLFIWAIYLLSSGVYLKPFSAELVARILLSLGIITLYWHVFRALIFYFRSRFPHRQQVFKRLLVTFLIGIIVASILSWLVGGLRHLINTGSLATYQGTEQAASFTLNQITISFGLFGVDVFQAILVTLFYQIIYETAFFIEHSALNQRRLKQAEREQEKLRTANLQSQLDALKQQVNPHFLFNSLNVLDSLIEDDPKQARVFLEELSTVYRYLLRSNEQHLTDLGTELEFIQSYFHLLQTRHGSGLSLNVAVDERFQAYQLPPLTLQLLVENAVKHNVVLPDQPLFIQIDTDSQAHLQVRNNVQRKTVRVASNGVGLSNILAKYRMLNQPEPSIREVEKEFVVTLPLIDP